MSITLKTYPEYRESGLPWLSQVPVHWRISPAFSVFRERNVRNTGMGERQVLSLSYGRIVRKSNDTLHGLVPESFETYQVIEPGNIVLRLTDLQNDQRSLRVGLARDRGIITSAYTCIAASGELLPDYAYFYLHTADIQKVFYGMGTGLRQSIGFPELRRLPVALPPIQEQRHIVGFLNREYELVSHYIRARRREIELLNDQKQVIVRHAVTGGNSRTIALKPSGVDWLGDIPSHWQVLHVKRICTIRRGRFSFRPRNDPSLYDGQYPFIQTGDVAQAGKVITKFSQTLNENGLAVSRVFPGGTLVMTIAANIGDVAILNFDACFPDSIVGFVPSPDVHRDYLYYVFLAMKPELLREAPVNTQGNLNVGRIGAMSIAVPPLAEQLSIVGRIESNTLGIEAGLALAKKEIDLVREYRNRLVAEVATGKLDVRGVEVPELEQLEAVALQSDGAESLEATEEEIVAPEETADVSN